MSLAKKALSGTLWTSGISYIGFAITFAIQLILVRLLVPEDFGIFALGLSVAELLFFFFSVGFSMAVIQIQEADDLFDTAFYLSILSGIFIASIGVMLSQLLSSYYPGHALLVLVILCALSPVQGCTLIYTASLEKEMQFKKTALAGSIASNISAVGAVILAYAGFGLWSLVGKELMKVALLFFSTRRMATYRFQRRFNSDTAKKLVSFGMKMLFSKGLEVLYYRVPQFVIGTVSGTKMLGLFSQTYYIASIPNVVLQPATSNIAFSTYSKLQHEKDKMSEAFYITNYFFIRMLLPLMLIFYLYPKEVIGILYGDQWIEASPMLSYFAIYAAFLPLFLNAKTFAYALGRLIEVGIAYVLKLALLAVGLAIALSVQKVDLGAMSYSISLIIGLFTIFHFLKKDALVLHLRQLFLVPVTISALIVTTWPFFRNVINIYIPEDTITGSVYLLMLYIFFAAVMLICEPKIVMNNVRYLQNKILLGK